MNDSHALKLKHFEDRYKQIMSGDRHMWQDLLVILSDDIKAFIKSDYYNIDIHIQYSLDGILKNIGLVLASLKYKPNN